MKTCFKCGESQPRENFYKHSKMADGLLGKCKSCTKLDVGKHRLENIEKIRAYDRLRSKEPERKKSSYEISARWRASDSRIVKCHNEVARAVKKGTLQKVGCAVCGSNKSEAHHDSYLRPLDVMWLCRIHHVARHKELSILGIDPYMKNQEDLSKP